MEDAVITEIRRIKDRLASEYVYDVRKTLIDAISKQKESGNRVVNLRKKKMADRSNEADSVRLPMISSLAG